jgi:hypothetical protein
MDRWPAIFRACRVSACAASLPRRARAAAALALAVAPLTLAGCGSRGGRHATDEGLSFETLPDTGVLVQGRPLLTEFEPYRASDGALRVRGRLDLPESTQVQIEVRRRSTGQQLNLVQVSVVKGAFDSPPIFAAGKAPPPDVYSFAVTSQFNTTWQSRDVLEATRYGLDLRGPGMRRGPHGEAVFRIVLEKRL